MKSSPVTKILQNSLVNLPTPTAINSLWNFGSILGLCLSTQILSGLFLSMYFCPESNMAFFSVSHIMRDVNYGWCARMIHANGASMFFISLYIHIARGIYFSSFNFFFVWMVGTSIFLMTMATAFLGYVLPWGQMSFWGATVITNLFSVIPFLGQDVVLWLWGGFAVSGPTLSRFFALHFFLPLMMLVFVIFHLIYLHQTGSNNPLGVKKNIDKVKFHSFFSLKDVFGFLVILFLFFATVFLVPWILGDTENFIPANPLVTPIHIQPEWYFLFAYAILRSIPNKLGGVVALAMAVIVLYFLPFKSKNFLSPSSMAPLKKLIWWWLLATFFLLTWIGARPVENPFLFIGQILTATYFTLFFSIFI